MIKSLTKACPICGSQAKRHRRRNWKHQYHCIKCAGYFTEEPLQKRQHASVFYDAFVEKYITTKINGKKVVILQLCKEFQLSRATVYRMKLRLDTLYLIQKWFSDMHIGVTKNVKNSTMHLKFQKGSKVKGISIKVDQSSKVPDECNVSFKFESDEPICCIWENNPLVNLTDAANMSIKLTAPLDLRIIKLLLSPLSNMLKN